MYRKRYFDYIEEKLNFLAYRIYHKGKLNLLELNIHSESFFAYLFNIVFLLNFENMNTLKQNVDGIDLIDKINKIVIQVSSTCTTDKIENSLKKEFLKDYRSYSFKFISIAKEVPASLKSKSFKNPFNLNFNPSEDLLDVVQY